MGDNILNRVKTVVFSACLMGGPNAVQTNLHHVLTGGGHTIGNGGDLAELEMARIWATVDQEVSPCQVSNPCDLSEPELLALKELLAQFSKRGNIAFATTDEDWAYQTSPKIGSAVTFNKRALYYRGQARPYDQLASLALEALLVQTKMDSSSAQQLAEKLANSWLARARSITGFVEETAIIVQWVNLKDRGVKVFFDLPAQAYDMTSAFNYRSPCRSQTTQTSLQDLRFEARGQWEFEVFGRILWSCADGKDWTAEFILKAETYRDKGQRRLVNDKIGPRLLYVRVVE